MVRRDGILGLPKVWPFPWSALLLSQMAAGGRAANASSRPPSGCPAWKAYPDLNIPLGETEVLRNDVPGGVAPRGLRHMLPTTMVRALLTADQVHVRTS